MRLQLQSTAIGNVESVRDLLLLMVVRLMMAERIYARIARVVQGCECRKEGCFFWEFHKQNLPTFNGEVDPMAAENWLLKMEKLLRALEYTNAQNWCMPLLLFRVLLKDGGQVVNVC